jgi:hypothetical protein
MTLLKGPKEKLQREKIFANHMPNKGFVSRIYKELSKLGLAGQLK